MKKRHSEEQIVKILHEAEAGSPIQNLCRKHNITEQSRPFIAGETSTAAWKSVKRNVSKP